MIAEIMWDLFANLIGLNEGLLRELIGSFLRAALIEESFKFFGFMKANKKYCFSNEKEYMFGAILLGIAVLFGVVYIIVSIIKIKKVLKENNK